MTRYNIYKDGLVYAAGITSKQVSLTGLDASRSSTFQISKVENGAESFVTNPFIINTLASAGQTSAVSSKLQPATMSFPQAPMGFVKKAFGAVLEEKWDNGLTGMVGPAWTMVEGNYQFYTTFFGFEAIHLIAISPPSSSYFARISIAFQGQSAGLLSFRWEGETDDVEEPPPGPIVKLNGQTVWQSDTQYPSDPWGTLAEGIEYPSGDNIFEFSTMADSVYGPRLYLGNIKWQAYA